MIDSAFKNKQDSLHSPTNAAAWSLLSEKHTKRLGPSLWMFVIGDVLWAAPPFFLDGLLLSVYNNFIKKHGSEMNDLIRYKKQISQQPARYGVKFVIYKNGKSLERPFPL